MKKNSRLISIMIYLICGLAHADEEACPFGGEENPQEKLTTPDHLEPVNPYSGDWKAPYMEQLKKYLRLDEKYLARMIVSPSFTAEYSMRVHGDADSYNIESSKKFFITYTIPDKSIWYSMPKSNSGEKPKTITPKSFTAQIPAKTAKRVCAIWDEMILRTRYSRDGGPGLDGITIEFASIFGHGEVWTPSDDTAPALLHELGEKLITYSKVAKKERKKQLDAIHKAATKLENHLKQKSEITPKSKTKTGEE